MATGDPELLIEYQRQTEEIFDITTWEQIARLIPGANIAFAFRQKAQALMVQRAVNDKILQDEIISLQSGETKPEQWKRVSAEEKEQDTSAIDYYNEERQKMLTWEMEAYAAASASKREAEIKARNDDAAFWALQAAKQRELEAQDRQAIADFWANYRKTQQKISEDNRPSNLNFGLL